MISSEHDFYANGLAVGGVDMLKEVALMKFMDENYEVPLVPFWSYMFYVKKFPAMKIDIVRKVGKRLP